MARKRLNAAPPKSARPLSTARVGYRSALRRGPVPNNTILAIAYPRRLLQAIGKGASGRSATGEASGVGNGKSHHRDNRRRASRRHDRREFGPGLGTVLCGRQRPTGSRVRRESRLGEALRRRAQSQGFAALSLPGATSEWWEIASRSRIHRSLRRRDALSLARAPGDLFACHAEQLLLRRAEEAGAEIVAERILRLRREARRWEITGRGKDLSR